MNLEKMRNIKILTLHSFSILMLIFLFFLNCSVPAPNKSNKESSSSNNSGIGEDDGSGNPVIKIKCIETGVNLISNDYDNYFYNCKYYKRILSSTTRYTFEITSINLVTDTKDLIFDSIDITGDDNNEFTINTTTLNFKIKKGETSEFYIDFTPTSYGNKTVYLNIKSNSQEYDEYSSANFSCKITATCTPYVNIDGMYAGDDPSITADDSNNIFIVYQDWSSPILSNRGFKLARTFNNGNLWYIKYLDYGQQCGLEPTILSKNNNLFVLYQKLNGGSRELKFALSTDSGDNWNVSILQSSINFESPSMALDNDRLVLSYNCDCDLYFGYSDNAYGNWNIVNIDSLSTVIQQSSISTYNGKIYICYFNKATTDSLELKLAISEDGGSTWQFKSIETVNTTWGAKSSIFVNNNNIYIGYAIEKELKFAKSNNNGNSWNIKTLVSPLTIEEWVTQGISLNSYNNYIYVSFCNECKLKIAKSIDSGDSWNIYIADDSDSNPGRAGVGWNSQLLIKNNKIHIAYYNQYMNYLKYAKSTDLDNPW